MCCIMDAQAASWTHRQHHGRTGSIMDAQAALWTHGQCHGRMASIMDAWPAPWAPGHLDPLNTCAPSHGHSTRPFTAGIGQPHPAIHCREWPASPGHSLQQAGDDMLAGPLLRQSTPPHQAHILQAVFWCGHTRAVTRARSRPFVLV